MHPFHVFRHSGAGLGCPQFQQRHPEQFLTRKTVGIDGAFVGLDDAPGFVGHHDDVVPVPGDQRQPLGQFPITSFPVQLLFKDARDLPAPDRLGRESGGHQHRKSDQRHGARLAAQRSIDLLLIHLRHHAPGRVRNPPDRGEHQNSAVVDALMDAALAADRHRRGQIRVADRKTQMQRGAGAMTQFAEKNHLVAVAARQQDLSGFARNRPDPDHP